MRYTHLSDERFSSHQIILSWIPEKLTALEIGCASGYMSRKISQKCPDLTCIEVDADMAHRAQKYCRQTIVCDIENPLVLRRLQKRHFELIVMADVVEHLRDPRKTLTELHRVLARNGLLLISVPNIAFLTNRLLHLLGRFDYTETGIMDRTHLKFYTKRTITNLLTQTGYTIEQVEHVSNFTQLPLFMQLFNRWVGRSNLWLRVEHALGGIRPELLAIQFLFKCRKT